MESNAAAKKATLTRHKAAFGLWLLVHQTLEFVVIRDRSLQGPFAGALDHLFIQAFKSHARRTVCVAYMKCTTTYVTKACQHRKIPFYVVGHRYVLNREDCDAHVKSRSVPAKNPSD